MKFSQMPYTRPDIDALKNICATSAEAIKNAPDAKSAADAFRSCEKELGAFSTLAAIARIRFTIDTRDEFYNVEKHTLTTNIRWLMRHCRRYIWLC